MEKKQKVIIEKEEEKVIEASCDFCGKKFEGTIFEFNGYGIIRFVFGFGSSFDDKIFYLEICDKCFIKNFANKLKKQFDENGFFPEKIKSILEKGT